MEDKIIECSKIEDCKVTKDLRSFSKEFAERLSESIRVEGLLQPILVRPNPEKPGSFIRVAGKHRHYAVWKILKEQSIRATVLTSFDPKDHEMALISENLWRNPLTKDQMALSIKKWHEYFSLKHAERPAIEVARSARKQETKAAAKEAESSPPETTEDQQSLSANLANKESDAGESTATAPPQTAETNFVASVAKTTNVSGRTANRLVKIAKLFSEDEHETFRQCRVTQDDQERLSKIKDAKLRSQVIALIASGLPVEESFKEVLKDKAPVKGGAGSNEVKAAKEEQAPTFTDEEWYTLYCGDKAALITADHTKFKSDALFYRAISEARNVFHAKIKKIVAAHKLPAGGNGPFYHLVKKVANVSGPKDWFICGGCNASGVGADGEKCSECYGAGYKVKAEVY